MSHLVADSVRVYRALLAFYSPGFRSRFGDEMLAVFTEACVDAHARRGSLGVARVWLDTLRDLVASATADRVDWLGHVLRTWPMLVRTRPAAAARQFVFASLAVIVVGKAIVPGVARGGASVASSASGATWQIVALLLIALSIVLVLVSFGWLEPLLRIGEPNAESTRDSRAG